MTVAHPGVRLREELARRGWAQVDLAEILGRPTKAVNEIIRGKRGISYRMAQELGQCFGSPNALEWRGMYDSYLLAKLEEKGPSVHRERISPRRCHACGAPWRAA